ncbi:autotransporter outer membrane beta-barrel domain-containing protein [Pseudomonas brassicacearum]|uniref:autotransporter family protein n=1 Tax=Pseudomonas brassicacearum TaxID=930166 RepID=UPI00025FFC39|nr:autotransporter outer membrane beta-barrel domain-containing protein [Pseudomonas brassicacearum]EIK66380.1 outer membrane autotransporter [Pseudomonas fluorescens Q8r1-96]KAB0526005.1 autotransporter outer membrane beta-barrel domain-containing protein [Pseudomonas brassicacearum subsp. brassicacearum]NJP63083.1 autotransporter outer membrane beta-barrel domain-containing protein [Pseudomonas brassicacearum]QEO78979.1 autotransporter outer membrane beta-barrel domain-containing protein [Pse
MIRHDKGFNRLFNAVWISTPFLLPVPAAMAACTLTPTAGDDAYVCDSGTSPGLTDLSGNNSLTMPANGSGLISGDVTFGTGVDRIVINANGVIDGDVEQGSAADDFVMNGGRILSLAQGDGLDTFLMSGGTIVDAFEDGDIAKMTGGTIGRVDMKLDDNVFDMSGGNIIGNLVTGFGQDTIILSAGRIGGNVSVSGGNDSITVSGGEILGEVRASAGDDQFQWSGGLIHSAVLMGDGSDTALLSNLDESLLATTPSVDGGLGQDALTFSGSTSSTGARYLNWETVNLTQGSRLDLDDTLTLGDSATATGTLNIDSGSTLTSTQGVIAPFTAGQLTTLNNAGVVDLAQGNTRTNDTLTVQGNYVGNNGQLHLQTVLGADNSPSDKLVVNGGTLTGSTAITVTNQGGTGAQTAQDGIEVVQAQGGAVSDSGAFSLAQSVSAGAFDYRLFKGGVTGNENNWYLRSTVVAGPIAAPSPTLPVLPAAIPGAAPIPLYRPEVPTWSVLPPAAAQLTLIALGTFHDRQGDQRLLTENGAFGAGWGRVYGKDLEQTWAGTVTPRFDGSIKGFQVGNDLYSSPLSSGQTQRIGFFVGHTELNGDVDGFNLGFKGRRAGKIELDGDSYGLYWTLTDPSGGYVDAVVMGTRLDGDNRSERGLKIDNRGHALTLSAEAGYPFAVVTDWVLEPQVQIIHQKVSLDTQDDGVSKVEFDSDSAWTGRLGARLKGRYQVSGMPVEPYLRANLWHTFSGTDTVTFDDTERVKTQQRASTGDLGVGVIVSLAPTVSVYAGADYGANLDSSQQRSVAGNLGVRISW